MINNGLTTLLQSVLELRKTDTILTDKVLAGIFEGKDSDLPISIDIESCSHLLQTREFLHFMFASLHDVFASEKDERERSPQFDHFRKIALIYKKTPISLMKEFNKSRLNLSIMWAKGMEQNSMEPVFPALNDYIQNLRKYAANISEVLASKSQSPQPSDFYGALLYKEHPRFSSELLQRFFSEYIPNLRETYKDLSQSHSKLRAPKNWGDLRAENYGKVLTNILNLFYKSEQPNYLPGKNFVHDFGQSYFKTKREGGEYFCRALPYSLIEYFRKNQLSEIYNPNKGPLYYDFDLALLNLMFSYFLSFNCFNSVGFLGAIAGDFEGNIKKLFHLRSKSSGTQNLFNLLNKVGDAVERPERDEISTSIMCSIRYVIERDLINGKIKTAEDSFEVWKAGTAKYFNNPLGQDAYLANLSWGTGNFWSSGFEAFAIVGAANLFEKFKQTTAREEGFAFAAHKIKKFAMSIFDLEGGDFIKNSIENYKTQAEKYLKYVEDKF